MMSKVILLLFMSWIVYLNFTPCHAGIVSHSQIKDARLQAREFFNERKGCHLKNFRFETFIEDDLNLFNVPGKMLSTAMIAAFETTDPSCVKDYAIVQWIRGCTFYSIKDSTTGKVSKEFAFSRTHRGKSIVFHHRNWSVDSDGIDPMYNANRQSQDPFRRHDLYRYPLSPLRFQNHLNSLLSDYQDVFVDKNWGLIGDSRLNSSILFVRDHPISADYQENAPDRALNTSFLFKTCLYKTNDVPAQGDPRFFGVSVLNGGPIHCFDWEHNYVFNFEIHEFEKKNEIDPFCLTLTDSY